MKGRNLSHIAKIVNLEMFNSLLQYNCKPEVIYNGSHTLFIYGYKEVFEHTQRKERI